MKQQTAVTLARAPQESYVASLHKYIEKAVYKIDDWVLLHLLAISFNMPFQQHNNYEYFPIQNIKPLRGQVEHFLICDPTQTYFYFETQRSSY